MALPSATWNADRQIVAAHQRPRLHQAAEPEPLARAEYASRPPSPASRRTRSNRASRSAPAPPRPRAPRASRRSSSNAAACASCVASTSSRMMSHPKTASHFSASCSSIEPEIFQALVQLPQPLGVVGDGLTGVGQRALRLVAIAHHHIGPHQPQPSLDVVTVLLQSGRRGARPCRGSSRRGRSRSCLLRPPSHHPTAPAAVEPPTRTNAA